MRRSAEVTEETRAQASSPANNTSHPPGRMTVIYVSYLIAALDVTMMILQFSVTPYLAIKLGMDTLQFGYLQTTVGVIQLFGGPMFGRFGDLFGARVALTVSCLASTVFFLLLAVANHPVMLFIHKLPTVFMHVLPVTQMVVADLSQPEKRADALSKFGLCFGFGMIMGSTAGGQLVKRYGESFAACVGAAGSAFSLLLVLWFIPKSTKQEAPKSNAKDEKDKQSLFNVSEITRLMKYPRVTRTFVLKIVSGLPSVIFQVMFSIIALQFFKLQPEENGYLMAYFGIVQMVMQGFVVGRLTARYSEYWLLVLSIGVSAMVGLAQALMQTVFHLCLTVVPMVFALSVFNVITDSILTKSVPSSDTGTMLGLCASVQSLLRTMGPTLGGYLYVNHGISSIGYSQFSINAFAFAYLLLWRLNKAPKQSE